MTFEETLQQTIDILQNRGRVSYRALKRQFDLDDAYLEDLKEEILYTYPQVTEEAGRGLVWPGTGTTSSPAEAERRQLTVMFCDLADSTKLAGQLDPEDLREVIRAYQETAVGVVQRHAGYAAQYLGDGLLIYFGWPQAHEDDAQRGVRAGLGIFDVIDTLNTRLEREKGVRLAVRIGIHTGLVVIGEVGGGGRHEQLALGETPNIASRLEELAAPNTVVISATTARLVQHAFALEDLGARAFKGMVEPMQVFHVVRERVEAEREATAGAASSPMLMGREAEMALLLERWGQSKAGRGQVGLLSGEAGIGKSRLLEALRARVSQDRHTQITLRCSPYHVNSALYPVITHLEQLLQLNRDDSPETKLATLARLLETYRFPNKDTLALLAGLLFIPLQEPGSLSHLTPEQQKRKTQEALLAWFAEEAERQPMLAVWEDLQWMDPSTLEFLHLLIDQAPTTPMLTVLTYRPAFEPPWGTRSYLTPITLGTLGPAQVEAIATTVAGGKALPADILTQIVEKTDGVPLFVEEMTKAILESGVLRDTGTRYELTGPMEAVTIPITLHDSLMARLDQLATAKNLAQLGAVIGRQFSYELIKALSGYDEARLQRELTRLVNAELLYHRGRPPYTTYRFKHALIQDVAYESLLRRRRQALHGAIAQTIETSEAQQHGEQAGILAYHYSRSAHQDKAVTYALLAGDQAVRLHARAEATIYYDQALALARTLPGSPEAHRLQIDTALKHAAVGTTRADLERDQENLEQVRALAAALQDKPRLAQVLYWLGRVHYVRAELPTAIAYAQQSLTIADRLADDTLAAPPVNLMGRVYYFLSDYANASRMLARSAEQMRRLGNTIEEATATGSAGVAYGYLGEFEHALAYADRGVQLAQESQNPFAETAAHFYRALVHQQRGSWQPAIADCETALRIAERVKDSFRVYALTCYAGWAQAMAGELAQGRMLLEAGMALAEQLGTKLFLAWGKTYLAACCLALGERTVVLPLCHEAIRLAEESHDRLAKAVAHRTLAEALGSLEPGESQAAEHAMLEAIRLQQEIGAKPELARSYVSYARLLQGWGEAAQAREYLTQAIGMFQQMDMAWDRAQAEQVLVLPTKP